MIPGRKVYETHIRETTRWEDILTEKEILRPDNKLETQKLAIEEAKQRGERKELSLSEKLEVLKPSEEAIQEIEEDRVYEDDDEKILTQFREKRKQELKKTFLENKFGMFETLARDEFMLKVKTASCIEGLNNSPVFVVVELYKHGIPSSEECTRNLTQLSSIHLNIKFVRMVANQCIPNWPDSNVPSIFIYFNGELIHQLIGEVACFRGNVYLLENALCSLMKISPKLVSPSSAKNYQDGEEDW